MSRTVKLYWYTGPLKLQVRGDLDARPDLVLSLGSFRDKFIVWCANQRVIFEPDIVEEVGEFIGKYINSRLYNVNINLWREISHSVFRRDNYTCQYCGQIGHSLEIDHIIPISKGGSNQPDNLITACRRCNRQKRDKTAEDFKRWRELNAPNKDNQTPVLVR